MRVTAQYNRSRFNMRRMNRSILQKEWEERYSLVSRHARTGDESENREWCRDAHVNPGADSRL